MSRFNLPDTQPIYDAAQTFVDACLRHDGSIFTPGTEIWTAANIGELYRRFNQRPDESSASFLDKFRLQLAGAPAAVYQLAGEVIYVHLLIATGSIGGHAKRQIIRTVLSWSPAPIAIPPERNAALDTGLARVGTAYLTYRPFQLWFLIEFVRTWKTLPAIEQARLLRDPWDFKDMLFGLAISRAYAQREALLHLVHPNTFEAIVSRQNKRTFVERFATYIITPSSDVDRDLLQIRTQVDQRYGVGHSLYATPVPGTDDLPPLRTSDGGPFPRTLGDQIRPYVKLVCLLHGSSYTPAQIVEQLGRVSPPIVRLSAAPDPAALVRDLTHLRLLRHIEGGGTYVRWAHLNDATEETILRYAALTLLVPQEGGGYELPILRAPFDGQPHPLTDWPYGEPLLRWYAEATLVTRNDDGTWQSVASALAPVAGEASSAKAITIFLDHLAAARASRDALPILGDTTLQVLDPDVLEARIAEIQRELLVDRSTILRIYRALIAGHHVILSGPPGTGKTHLASILPRVLWRDSEPVVQRVLPTDPLRPPTDPPEERQFYRDGYAVELVTATEDWGVRNVIGGIVPQIQRSGTEKSLVFTIRHGCLTHAVLSNYAGYDGTNVPPGEGLVRQEVRDGAARCRGRWLVIDEFTRAPIDAAFGSLLTTLGGQGSPLLVPTEDGDTPIPLPKDFRLIGTLNSFDRHFLNQISEAMKRRFTFIDVLPPPRTQSAAEQAMAARRALRRLDVNRVIELSEDPARGQVIWEDVLRITTGGMEGAPPPYRIAAEDAAAGQAITSFWRTFQAIRTYRQLGTAQAEAVFSALFSGYATGMSWAESLDTALADVLADQLQVLSRDEQSVLLAYLRDAVNAETFTAAVRNILSTGASAQRQRSHLGLLGLSQLTDLSAERLGATFDLGTPLIIPANGLFARRLESFIFERGL